MQVMIILIDRNVFKMNLYDATDYMILHEVDFFSTSRKLKNELNTDYDQILDFACIYVSVAFINEFYKLFKF